MAAVSACASVPGRGGAPGRKAPPPRCLGPGLSRPPRATVERQQYNRPASPCAEGGGGGSSSSESGGGGGGSGGESGGGGGGSGGGGPGTPVQAVLRWEVIGKASTALSFAAAIVAAWPPLQQHLRAEKERRAAKVRAQAALLTAMEGLRDGVAQLRGDVAQLRGEVKKLGWKLDCLLVGVAVAFTKAFF